MEDTKSVSRERFAMKVLNMKRANKMANKATDSNIMAEDGALPVLLSLSVSLSLSLSLSQASLTDWLCTTGDGDDVWVEVQVAQHVGPHPNIVGLREVIQDEDAEDIRCGFEANFARFSDRCVY